MERGGGWNSKLEEYVKLKELLNIARGIEKASAIEYDNFKRLNKKEYNALVKKLGNRMIALRPESDNIPSFMFMIAMYLTYPSNLSTRMTFEEYRKVFDSIDTFQFTMG